MLEQQFSTGVLQEFLKHAISDYLVRDTDLFSLRLSNKKVTTFNTTIAICCECPVGNHKYIGHVTELHLNWSGHIIRLYLVG